MRNEKIRKIVVLLVLLVGCHVNIIVNDKSTNKNKVRQSGIGNKMSRDTLKDSIKHR